MSIVILWVRQFGTVWNGMMTKKTTSTKSRILSMSRSLFSVHGFDNTTLGDIITASGITKGAFYYYFKSKESLCENVIDLMAGEYQQLVASVDKSAEPIEQLRRLVAKIIQLNLSGEWANCRLILRLSLDSNVERPEMQRKLNDFWQWYRQVYADLIENCRSLGQLSTAVSKDVQVEMLQGSILGMIMLGMIDPDRKTSLEMAEMIVKSLG